MIDSSSKSDFVSSLLNTTDSAITADSCNHYASGKSVSDIMGLVKYAVGKIVRQWSLTAEEIEDLRQDGFIAALDADRTYDPRLAAWSTWVMRRVIGQLKTSIRRLRGSGLTGVDPTKPPYPLISDSSVTEFNSDDEEKEPDLQAESLGVSVEDAAEITGMMQTLQGCLDEQTRTILSLYYGLDGERTLTVSQLAEELGFSRKHTFTLLQKAQNSARYCLGVRNSEITR